jgi:uncharacterized protein (DUF2236 family)
MVTVYGARGTAEAMIARVRRMHDMVAGTTSSGEAYCANDPELLNWVHATAAYGFVQANHTYVRPAGARARTTSPSPRSGGSIGRSWPGSLLK